MSRSGYMSCLASLHGAAIGLADGDSFGSGEPAAFFRFVSAISCAGDGSHGSRYGIVQKQRKRRRMEAAGAPAVAARAYNADGRIASCAAESAFKLGDPVLYSPCASSFISLRGRTAFGRRLRMRQGSASTSLRVAFGGRLSRYSYGGRSVLIVSDSSLWRADSALRNRWLFFIRAVSGSQRLSGNFAVRGHGRSGISP